MTIQGMALRFAIYYLGLLSQARIMLLNDPEGDDRACTFKHTATPLDQVLVRLAAEHGLEVRIRDRTVILTPPRPRVTP